MAVDKIWLIRAMIFLIAGLISLLFTERVCRWQFIVVGHMQKIPILKYFYRIMQVEDERIIRSDRNAGVVFLIISAGIFVFLVF